MQRNVALSEFLTPRQIRTAIRVWNAGRDHLHDRILREVVLPAMPEINRKLGQENDPHYIAYAIEYALSATLR